MKPVFTRSERSAPVRHDDCPRRSSSARNQSGVALIITLILLSVITFMAIAFLVLTRGQRLSVGGATEQAVARLAADTAQERALAELMAPMLAGTNEFNFDLLVSTNYSNPVGFIPGVASLTNIGFTYANGAPLNPADSLRNLTNLLYNPRVPVFITNSAARTLDFRYYYDANWNNRFDPSGALGITNRGQPVRDTASQLTLTNFLTGDPQWIGGLQFVDRPHSAENPFLYRYAYLVVPSGKTLDINHSHNAAKLLSNIMETRRDSFFRNQGVGSWELNLASFLVDLNTNYWPAPRAVGSPYTYNTNLAAANVGAAFEDASSLLGYRYNWNPNSLFSVRSILGQDGANAFGRDLVDGYSAGPLMVGNTWNPGGLIDQDQSRLANRPWSGADNTNRYFNHQDLVSRAKVRHVPADGQPTFVDRVISASNDTNTTYNQYTFYRLLSQLGTDSAPEPAKAINLNYDNLSRSNLASGVVSATNFLPWQPIAFFTNTANALLADAGFKFPVNRIQIYPTNYYSAAVHRMLQVAANIYDATTNRAYNGFSGRDGFPTVFRPVFQTTNTPTGPEVYITGYYEVTNHLDFIRPQTRFRDLSNTNDLPQNANDMVLGIPAIIGARKGFPNFNELGIQTAVRMTRKLEFLTDPTVTRVVQTNQLYTLSISNSVGLEAWNSYSNVYPRNLIMLGVVDMSASLIRTNEGAGWQTVLSNNVPFTNFTRLVFNTNIPAATWTGFDPARTVELQKRSFITPFVPETNWFFSLPEASITKDMRRMEVPYRRAFEPETAFPIPDWFLKVNTRLWFVLYDAQANRVIDYVNLASNDEPINICEALASDAPRARDPYRIDCSPGAMWITNRSGTNLALNRNIQLPTYGILNQIAASLGTNTQGLEWHSQNPALRIPAQNFFRTNLLGWPPLDGGTPVHLYRTNRFFAPYQPTRAIYLYTSWQANDPLVHYTIGDLTPIVRTNRFGLDKEGADLADSVIGNIRKVNTRYEPWGGYATRQSTNNFALELKDPLVRKSDDWDFPTNKFPNVGWLGRVHRGTPWQTVYLKSSVVDLQRWKEWSGNGRMLVNGSTDYVKTNLLGLGQSAPDAVFTHPTNDWRILDLFTTAFNENASRGKLSVNQTNLAAWSAVLGGVVALTNNYPPTLPGRPTRYDPFIIEPAGYYDPAITNGADMPAVLRIVTAMNTVRATNNPTRRVFDHLGDILAVPELTVESPFLNRSTQVLKENSINDAAYERLPQQILGLLHCSHEPRFVIYSYGQSLKPAPKSIVTSGASVGLCTNYQVTAEVATRAVVRVEGFKELRENPRAKLRAVVEDFTVLPPE